MGPCQDLLFNSLTFDLGLQPQGSVGSSRLRLTNSRRGLWIISTLEMAAQICALGMDAANRAPVCE